MPQSRSLVDNCLDIQYNETSYLDIQVTSTQFPSEGP